MAEILMLTKRLQLPRCPHCGVHRPNLNQHGSYLDPTNHAAEKKRIWGVYACEGCGGVVTAWALHGTSHVVEHFPSIPTVEADLPERAQSFLEQALASIHAPAGAVMLAASAVDAMLKAKDYKEGSLFARIASAAEDHLITSEMAEWAHEVRLDANDQRHADENSSLPTEADARRSIDFARALGMFMFTLPARVKAGREATKGKP